MRRSFDVEKAAETHFNLRLQLVAALKHNLLTPEGQRSSPVPAANYHDYWVGTYGDRWFDMATLLRVATGVESSLRDCHRALAPAGRRASRGLFQRLVKPPELLAEFDTYCGLDLAALPCWEDMRELMVHRHLYAHRSGSVDSQYIDDFRLVTGRDVTLDLAEHGYPDQEIVWFEPLNELTRFINTARTFVGALPESPP